MTRITLTNNKITSILQPPWIFFNCSNEFPINNIIFKTYIIYPSLSLMINTTKKTNEHFLTKEQLLHLMS